MKLAPLDTATPTPASAALVLIPIGREIGVGGVCTLALSQPWSEQVDAAVADELRRVSDLQDVRAVLVEFRDARDLPGAPEAAARFMQAAQDCAVPVVAALPEMRGECAALSACDFSGPQLDAVELARSIARARAARARRA